MTLLKVEGVSNDVFIPEDISQEDQNFLLERTENIVGIVTRAKVEIGNELLTVEQHFRDCKEFSGSKGWYQKWYRSLGISDKQKSQFVNASLLLRRTTATPDLIDGLGANVLNELSVPDVYYGKGNVLFSGLSDKVAQQVIVDGNLSTLNDRSDVSSKDLGTIKATAVSQILSAEEAIKRLDKSHAKSKENFESGPTQSEDLNENKRLNNELHRSKKRLEVAHERLASLQLHKEELEAKYEDWRSPEAIKQELDEAIKKTRSEVSTKEAAKQDNTAEVKAMKELHLKEVQENQKLKEKLKELENQPAPEPDMATAKAIARAELEGEVAVKIKEIEMRTKQQLEAAEEKVRKAEAAKRSAQNSRKELQDELELAQQNTPRTPEWVLATITNHITNFKTACDEFNGIKRQDGKSGELTDMDQYAVEAMQHWVASFSPVVRDQVISMLQSQATVQNTLTTTTISQIIDV